jgi:predicted membrane protein DUF2207
MTLRRLHAVAAVTLLILLTFASTMPALAQSGGRAVSWPRFDVDLDIQRDGSVNVTEAQVIQFNGTFQSGFRVVPLDRTTGVTNVSIAELVNGQPVAYTRGTDRPNTFSTSSSADGLHIDWWFNPTPSSTAVKTFVVRYTATGAVRIYDGGDQLQWRAIYADRSGTVGPSIVTVHLPGDVNTSSVQSAWYAYQPTGAFGALNASASGVPADGRTVSFSINRLDANVGAEVRVQFPHGLVTAAPPPWQVSADRADAIAQSLAPIGTFLALLLTLAIAAGGGAFLFWLWLSNGRDPSIGAVPRRLEQPPSDLPAPVAGTLVDEVASTKEVVAALVEMADRGLIQLTDIQNAQLVGSGTDVRISLLARLNDNRFRPYERALLEALFGLLPQVPSEVLLSNAKQRFQAAIPTIDARLYEAVTQAGHFVRNPQTTRAIWYGVGATVIVLGIALAVAAGVWLTPVVPIAFLPGLALLGLGIAGVLLAGAMPRRTPQGALEAARWRAFRTYLSEVARDPQPGLALPPHYLPYAVAFGSDRVFVRHLEQVGTPPPTWYGRYGGPGPVVMMPGGWYGGPWHGGTGQNGGAYTMPGGGGGVAAPPAPNPQGWSDALAALLNAASSAMAHGGGSGGWSGGGFGGGGGGGGGSGGFR